MKLDNSLESVIRQYVKLGQPNSRGWESCLHLTCDAGRKGDRAAFLFSDDSVIFHCFNCGTKTGYNPTTSRTMSNTMTSVLNDFGIPEEEWQAVLYHSLQLRDGSNSDFTSDHTQIAIVPKPIAIPPTFYSLSEASKDDKWAEIARYYIHEERLLDSSCHPFMLSRRTEDIQYKKWHGRLIIPIIRNDEYVFYQGRDLTGTKQRKYESPAIAKDRIIYGFDKLYVDRDKPLYVVEGVFDAMLLNGAAILGNQLSDAQIAWLDKSPRQKVYIPDRFGNGRQIAEKCLDLGWSVSVPYDSSWDSSLKDVTDMIRHYGRLFVMAEIIKHTATGIAAETRLKAFCKSTPAR